MKSGWDARLILGPFDGEEGELLAVEQLMGAPEFVHVYRCPCCAETAIVAPGLHPGEAFLGPASVYELVGVVTNPGRGALLAIYRIEGGFDVHAPAESQLAHA